MPLTAEVEQDAFFTGMVEEMRRRQHAGELARPATRSSTVVHRTVTGEHVETEVRGGIAPH